MQVKYCAYNQLFQIERNKMDLRDLQRQFEQQVQSKANLYLLYGGHENQCRN